MRIHLPPDDERPRREVAALARVGSATDEAPTPRPDPREAGRPDVRIVRLAAGAADAYFEEWIARTPPARRFPAGPGVDAAERLRPTRGREGGRLLRLAVIRGQDAALAGHFGAPAPLSTADADAWLRMVRTLRARLGDTMAWRA